MAQQSPDHSQPPSQAETTSAEPAAPQEAARGFSNDPSNSTALPGSPTVTPAETPTSPVHISVTSIQSDKEKPTVGSKQSASSVDLADATLSPATLLEVRVEPSSPVPTPEKSDQTRKREAASSLSPQSRLKDVDAIGVFKKMRGSWVGSEGYTPPVIEDQITEPRDKQFRLTKGEVQLKSILLDENAPRAKQKKGVIFCDSKGIVLAKCRIYEDQEEAPEVPQYATAFLRVENNPDDQLNPVRYEPNQLVLRPTFSQPGAASGFMKRVHDNKVALEFCLVSDEEMTVTGTVRVANVAFHKHVFAHYTFVNWITTEEIEAHYVHYSSDGTTDRFNFVINLPPVFVPGSQLQLAIRYEAGSDTYWDNNSGNNYKIDCLTKEMIQSAANASFSSLSNPSATWLQYL